jgi:hypothetical protein
VRVSILLIGIVPCIVALPFVTFAAVVSSLVRARHRALALGRLRSGLPARHGAPGVVIVFFWAWHGMAVHFAVRGIP